ncbi:hypothetical protein CGC56_08590 [Capnocytophaga canimorsus]|uniref:Uncharacterized protein n=1 Tax=Capnocytophaga canimorsus TaxID=28188 RepID=A0A250G608_9FLAO|nr:hypothetical protein CGC56_08590 [Capnocytophaga canimorsus]
MIFLEKVFLKIRNCILFHHFLSFFRDDFKQNFPFLSFFLLKGKKYLHLRTSLQIVGNGFQNMLRVYLVQAFQTRLTHTKPSLLTPKSTLYSPTRFRNQLVKHSLPFT